jgi:TRAP-type C4-dicarboxylate transport system permease small subunit
MDLSRSVTRVLNIVIVVLFVSMTLVLTGSIVSRTVQPFLSTELNVQIPWSEEFIKYVLLWICWLGAAIVVHENGHFALNFLSRMLPGRRIFLFFRHLSTMILAAVFIYYGTEICINMIIQKTPSLQIPKTLINMVVPVTGVLFVFYTLVDLRSHKKDGA